MLALMDDYKTFVNDMSASSAFRSWKKSNPGEYAKWQSFDSDIQAGRTPANPSLATAFGKGMVDGGMLYLHGQSPVTQPPITQPPVTQPPTQPPASGLGTALPARMAESSGGQILIVAASGNDSNSGAATSPLKTIPKALSMAQAGALIQLRSGTYQNSGSPYDFISSGVNGWPATNPVTIMSYPGEKAVITGSDDQYVNGFTLENCQGVRFRNLEFTRPGRGPNIRAIGLKLTSCFNIEIDHCYFHDIGVYDNNSGGQGVLFAKVDGARWTEVNAFQIWNTEFKNCSQQTLAEGGRKGHCLYIGDANNGVVANCLFHHHLGGYALHFYPCARNVIATNNTMYSFPQDGYHDAILIETYTYTPPTQNCKVLNSIAVLASHVIGGGSSAGGCSIDYVCYNEMQSPAIPTSGAYTIGSHNFQADPLFVNAAGGDFHLKAGSPVIKKGDPAYTPPYDYYGNPRQGADLGAIAA